MARAGSTGSATWPLACRPRVVGLGPLVEPRAPWDAKSMAVTSAARAIWVPKTFVRYACERQLVCCRAPIRAPVGEAEEARITEVLGHTDAGRVLAADLPATIERDGARPIWRQRQADGRCAHLLVPQRDATPPSSPSCRLQDAGGFHALPTACRNFPRSITRLDDALEVVFALSCPTAARLLVEGAAEPFAWVALPIADPAAWPYTATRVAASALRFAEPGSPPGAPETASQADLLALRAAWWEALARDRNDAERLLALLGALLDAPTSTPPASARSIPDTLGEGLRPPLAHRVVDVLGATPGRGAHYRKHFWTAFEGLLDPVTPKALAAAAGAAPELIEAFVSHELAWAGLHDDRPIAVHWRLTVRRAILATRLVDALLTSVPLPTATLFRDAFAITPFFDP